MAKLDDFLEDLVTANRILAGQGIVDSYGHVTVRSPDDPKRYYMSRARAPERVEIGDIMEFTLEGDPIDAKGRRPYLERYIHGAAYEMRPDVMSVVHNHSPSTIPYGVTGRKMRPLMHVCGSIGHQVPIWDSHKKFGDTDLLVTSMAMGRDLAKTVAKGPTALMRGHGAVVVGTNLRLAVFTAVYLELNAKLQAQAEAMGKVRFLTKGEVDKIMANTVSPANIGRAWENWCRAANRPYNKE